MRFLRDMDYLDYLGGGGTAERELDSDTCKREVKKIHKSSFIKREVKKIHKSSFIRKTIDPSTKWYLYQVRVRVYLFWSRPLGDPQYFQEIAWASAYSKLNN